MLLVFMMPSIVGWGQQYTELFSINSGNVVSGTSYKAHTATVDDRDYVITFGGNNNSVGTNSSNRNNCNLSSYSKYAISPVTTSSVASAFACTTSISNVSKIKYTFNGGSNQTNTKVYLLYSSNNSTFSQMSLTSGTQGAAISSGTEYVFSECDGYFALLFEATNSSGNWRIDNVTITFYEASGPTYTIVAQSNNDSYGTASLSGNVITATPEDGYRVSTTNPYTVSPANSATVTQSGNTFTVTPTDNTTVTINFEEIPTHAAYFSVNGETTSSQVVEGAAITFPADPADIGDMTFMGWTDAAIDGITDTHPTYVTSATMGSNDVTFYAVFAEVGEGGPDTYEMLNSNSFDANAKYVIGATQLANDNTMWYFYSYDDVDENINWGVMTNSPATNSPVEFTLSGTASSLVAQDDNGNYLAGLTTGKFKMSSTSTTIALATTGEIKNSNTGSYSLRHNYNGGNGGLRWYSSSTGTAAYFYKVIPGVTYSNYCTTVGAIITVNPDAIELAADELEGTTGITFANLEITEPWEDCHVTFYDATGTTVVTQPDWVIDALVAEDNNAYFVSCAVYANEGPARTAYFKVYAYDENDNAVYSNLVTLSQAGYVMPSSVETWELTTLSELTADDVFVIVCYDEDLENSYAMANDNGTSAPSAVVVTVDNDALTTAPADNLKWNVESTENGYIFYPNGSSDTWLYCINDNNGVRVGTGEAKHFTIDGVTGYLTTIETSSQRYLGVYTSTPDWRCYTSINANIVNQTFAFYKKVAAPMDTNTKTIQPYNSTYDHYYLIASPVMAVEPSVANGFLTNNYDLYRFDQSHEDEEWLNYEVTPFYLLSGKGYLYANSGNNGNATTITFTGVPYNGNGEVTLSKVPGVKFSGWNLIGNPRNATAILKDADNQNQAYYTINQTNNEVAAGTLGADISAMEGVFVVAENDGDVVTFALTGGGGAIGILPESPEEPAKKGGINLNISKPQGLVIDRAIVRFDNGGQLPKFQLNPNNTKIYFTEDNKDFAVVRSANEGEMPVNFRAAENGTYSLSVEVSDTEMAYLHLIDNKTGVDVDLLANPSYTFEANANDYESRFRLVFNATGVEENNTNETFAFFNGSEWVINTTGNATLQVVDMMGRVLSSEQINGNTAVNLNQAAGIYVLRLVNGENVMVQKVVVR